MAIGNVANIIMGPATVYVGALGLVTAAPLDTAVNSVPASGSWTDVGGTDGGVTFQVTPKFSQLSADQVVDTIDERMTSREIKVTTTLAETTLANLALALNGSVGSTGAGYATFSPNFDFFASQTQKVSLLIDGFAPSDTVANARRRLYLARVQQTGAIKPAFSKDKQVGFDVEWTAYYVSSSVPPFKITDQTSA